MKKIISILGILSFIGILILNSCTKEEEVPPPVTPISSCNYGSFIDNRDGKVYKTIVIGNQTWMAENLLFKDVNGGCWAYNDNDSLAEVYGYLYDWETANNVAPSGWHLPSKSEWEELINYLGGENIAGGKIKLEDTTYWNSPNTNATNSSCFSALPGGLRYAGPLGGYMFMGNYGYWWTSTEDTNDTDNACHYNLLYTSEKIQEVFGPKQTGHSVRCIKDD